MVQLLIWMIVAYGLSNIVVYGSIFNGPRNFINKWGANEYAPFHEYGEFISKMISCMMCFGFHCGWFLSLTLYSPTEEFLYTSSTISWFFDAFLSSGSVWVINSIIEWFETNRPTNNN